MTTEFKIPYKNHFFCADFSSHTSGAYFGCILYLHGGGLVFGTRDDLPVVYKNQFLVSGFDFLALDYPLAPESDLFEITDAVHAAVQYLQSNPHLLGYSSFPRFFIFGRSAGAYLALLEGARLKKEQTLTTKQLIPPAAVISFYGYHSLSLLEFKQPLPYYEAFLNLEEKDIYPLIKKHFLTNGPISERYAIYIYARQKGCWTSLLSQDDPSVFSLTDEELASLPPCFFTASSSDEDVPFRESKYMAAHVPGSFFSPVYYLPHDFDRDPDCEDAKTVYRELLTWLKSI